MNAARLGTVIGLELRQRVRSVAWYVMLGIFAAILLLVTALAFAAFSLTTGGGPWLFSLLVFLVLLLVVLVSPTFSGSAVNGDRDAATLAPLQVTLVTTAEIIVGKFLAAWITGLAFLAVALPFLLVATAAGGLGPLTALTSLAVLIVEVGVVAAIGVGFSAVLARPLFSVASTYLVVAALTIGTVIAFGLGGTALRTEVTTTERYPTGATASGTACGPWQESTYDMPRFDRVWWVLAANPFVIMADATPTEFNVAGYPEDLFGQIAFGVRSAQIVPETDRRADYCDPDSFTGSNSPTASEVMAETTPSWFIGLLLQFALAAGLLLWGWARTRTPAKALPPGTRIA
ncbi:ABC transporter permease [Microbacterium sp. P05]|uniref:ABC transporter permease n=1 Tax=Microbacterium sp. P05 TaxID=3366948 RepID=UPI003745B033